MTLLEAILAALTVFVFFASCTIGFLLFSIMSFTMEISEKLDRQGIPDDLEDYLRPISEQISKSEMWLDQIDERLRRVNKALESDDIEIRNDIIHSELMSRNVITPQTVRDIVTKAKRIQDEIEREEGVKP